MPVAEELRPTVLVDMDGPLADFDAHFFKRCDEEGFNMDCDVYSQTKRFATDHIIDKHQRALAREMVNTSGWFRDLPVTRGSQVGLNRLAGVADVWICTKPLEANPTCRDDKAWWLAKYFGERWLTKLIITPNKSMVRGDILLDDAPHIDWLEHAAWHSVIFPTSWNDEGSKWAGMPRWSWDEDTHKLLALAGL